MTSRDPELTLGAELRNISYQLQVYRALAIATNDVDRRALQQQYGFTEVQALAVMDMQFRILTH
jgi:hypothetical protein